MYELNPSPRASSNSAISTNLNMRLNGNLKQIRIIITMYTAMDSQKQGIVFSFEDQDFLIAFFGLRKGMYLGSKCANFS
eukprot:m.1657474 g.1657474  ORF g.1657474 m.1657474 type:complete len:79 (-) comp112645_c0_seq1:31-267(-)